MIDILYYAYLGRMVERGASAERRSVGPTP